MRRSFLIAPFALISAVSATPAMAQVAGIDAIKEWNLIVLGDLESSSEVDGRTFVGGNLSGNSSNYQIKEPTAPSVRGTPGLTVVGNVEGGTKNLNFSSGAIVGGNVTSGFNLNGLQTVQVGGTIRGTNVNQNTVVSNLNTSSPQFRVDLEQQKSLLTTSLTGLSTTLSNMAETGRLVVAHNRGTFNAVPGADGVAVFNITAADLNNIGEIQFNAGTATTVIVNVRGTDIVLNDNFLGNATGLGEKVIWNFPDAKTLTASTAWKGSVLAPNAAGRTGNFIEGSAVFASLKQDGEMHLGMFKANFSPPSPTPAIPDGGSPTPIPEASFGLFALGALGLAAVAARRRRKKSAA